ncbi:DELLA protein RGL1-like [Canna indica]|uniref:DELLA protein RGL1-like n=1 Tax=Canna indica TaxID=4628 RepID=A0AAQ3QC70_9LILI|nr:DELLA protein RGL1-like [Canna indica]
MGMISRSGLMNSTFAPVAPPALRITGVGHPADAMREIDRHLAELAHSLCVPFEFLTAVVDRLEDLRPTMEVGERGAKVDDGGVERRLEVGGELDCVAGVGLRGGEG